MAGSDRSKVRDNPWDPLAKTGRVVVWNSRRGKPSWPAATRRINRPDIWMQAIRSDLEKLLRHEGRPHMHGRGHPSPWLIALLKRKPPKLAAVALANKMARIAWKLMVTGESYDGARMPGASVA